MRTLQPADWSKPRGFSHGIAFEGAGRWIVLAGQTGGDEKGEYQPEMAAQVAGALRRIVRLLGEAGAGPEHIVRLTWYLTSRFHIINVKQYLTKILSTEVSAMATPMATACKFRAF